MEKMHHLDYYESGKHDPDAEKRYSDFMENPCNIRNCAECPERDLSDHPLLLPCGQQHCWVEICCE
jgi:hypothetical protein